MSTSGSLIWKYNLPGDVSAPPALAKDGTVYVVPSPIPPPALLLAITSAGQLKWSVPLGSSSSSGAAVGVDGTIYVGCEDRNLYAINPAGIVIWTSLVSLWDGIGTPVIGLDRTIYVTAYAELVAINATGTIQWSYHTGGKLPLTAVSSDGTVYIGSGDSHVYAISSDGKQKWNYTMDFGISSQPVLGSDGMIYAASWYFLYVLTPEGRLISQISSGGWVAVFGQHIYVGEARYLHAFTKTVTGKSHAPFLPFLSKVIGLSRCGG